VNDYLIYSVSIAVAVISFYFFRATSGSMAFSRLNLMSVAYYYHFLLISFVGGVIIVTGGGDNSVIHKLSDSARMLGWVAICYALLVFPVGAYLAKRIVLGRKAVSVVYNEFLESPVTPILSRKDSCVRLPLLIISLICFFSALYMLWVTKKIPQLELLNFSGYSDLLLFRNSINRDFGGIYYIKSIVFEQLTPLLSLVAYSYYSVTKSKLDRLWFYFMLLLSLNALTFSLAKSPLFAYAITFVILRIYLYGGIPVKRLAVLFLILSAGLFFVFYFVMQNDLSNAVFYLISRIFVDQISGMFLMFEIFPDNYDFIGIGSLSKPLSSVVLGEYSPSARRIAMLYAFAERAESGEMNLLSTLFIGEAWANFGWIGFILSPLYMGFILGVFYYMVIKTRKNPITCGFLAYYTFSVGLSSQFNVYIYNPVFMAVLFVFAASFVFSVEIRKVLLYEKSRHLNAE